MWKIYMKLPNLYMKAASTGECLPSSVAAGTPW